MLRRLLFGIIISCLLAYGTLTPQMGEAAPKIETKRPHYKMDATYDHRNERLSAHMKVTLPQKMKKQKEAYFHLYPNAFRKWRYGQTSKPTKPGYIDISQVRVNSQTVTHRVRETVMRVDIPKSANKAETIVIEMDFTVQMPHGGTRLNVFRNTAFLAQWYPMLAVNDRDGWHIDPYTTTGDPFYSVMSDFDVTFYLPPEYQVISTANDQNHTQQSVVRLKQDRVRDFVAVLSKDYRVMRKKTDGIEVNLWYLHGMDDVRTSLHQAAVNGMEFYNKRFGKYPYKEVDVVLGDTGYGIAGMEYPGLVTSIPKIPTRKGEEPAVNVVVHELAHQWWYGLVGNNQVKEPWLDEGLTTFSEFLYMQEQMKESEKELMDKVTVRTNEIHRSVGITSAESLYRYPDSVYGMMVYVRPAAMLFDLMKEVGQDKMMEVLSTYFQAYQYKVATAKDFMRIANQVTGKDLSPFFDKWLYFKTR